MMGQIYYFSIDRESIYIFHSCSTFNAFNKPDKECKTMEYP